MLCKKQNKETKKHELVIKNILIMKTYKSNVFYSKANVKTKVLTLRKKFPDNSKPW